MIIGACAIVGIIAIIAVFLLSGNKIYTVSFNTDGGSPSALNYYLNHSVDDIYTYGKLITGKNYYPMYLVAEVNGQNVFGEWNNVSDKQVYSKLIVDEDMDDKGFIELL